MRAANNEMRLLALVGKELRIDPDGSVWRITASTGGGRPSLPVTPRRIDRAQKDGYGRVAASLHDGKPQIRVLAHRLVWVAARGRIPDGMEINHKNGIKNDNRLDNLEIVTPRENTIHRISVLGHAPVGLISHWRGKPARMTTCAVCSVEFRLPYPSDRRTLCGKPACHSAWSSASSTKRWINERRRGA